MMDCIVYMWMDAQLNVSFFYLQLATKAKKSRLPSNGDARALARKRGHLYGLVEMMSRCLQRCASHVPPETVQGGKRRPTGGWRRCHVSGACREVSAVRMRGVLLPRVVLRCCFTVFFFFFFFFPCAGREIYSYAKTNKNEKGGGPRGTPRTGPGSTLSKRYG
ncbi:YALI0F15015p [Yarrowia lipolytica CLIB122]|uniref:YALI0F15015p n=1 Tax=Yarrowia lipolytica (strain CLIB 122 / E 150) TaxID=284591 RepID=Q6C1M3_YARLI|nr:YALI0F15015p [Yarrowia lipolytica CLIB122]CAG78248.1 YALI0F15015p [Yarrowia lipolytica CLIB122]|eukprot:XP_505439.1 YALI0F15015p [Yarrowia lipolytica CLIB122]